MDSAPVGTRSLRVGASVVALVASGLLVLIGCTRTTEGHGSANSGSISEYKAFVTESVAEESSRQAASTTKAMSDTCGTFAMASGAAVTSGNDLIDAMNNAGGYTGSAADMVDAVINALNTSATQVDNVKAQAYTDELRDALSQYSDQARGLATAFQNRLSGEDLNGAVRQFNDARLNAQNVCQPFLPKS